MTTLKRIIIYPKDVAIVTGKSDRYGRMLIANIKQHLGKEDHQLVTIEEFANYIGVDPNLVAERII